MRFSLLLLALLAPLGLTLAADEGKKDSKKPEDLIVGTWKLTAFEMGGKKATLRGAATSKFKDGKYDLKVDGEEQEAGTFKLDSTKTPNWLDFAIEAGNDKGKKQVGIVVVDGETLKFCLSQPGKEDRPKKFETSEEDQYILVTMKRVKE